MYGEHCPMKDGACSADSGDAGHGGVVEIANPDADGDLVGEAEAPVVPEI